MGIFKSWRDKLIRAALEEEVMEYPEIIAERLGNKGCATCPKNHEKKCLECGCYIELKAAMDYNVNIKKWGRVEKTHCPLGKWSGINEVTGEKYDNDKHIANYYRSIDNLKQLI